MVTKIIVTQICWYVWFSGQLFCTTVQPLICPLLIVFYIVFVVEFNVGFRSGRTVLSRRKEEFPVHNRRYPLDA